MKQLRPRRNPLPLAATDSIDRYRAQHLSLVDGVGPDIGAGAKFDEAESPLVWLARRKGADGRALTGLGGPAEQAAVERFRLREIAGIQFDVHERIGHCSSCCCEAC